MKLAALSTAKMRTSHTATNDQSNLAASVLAPRRVVQVVGPLVRVPFCCYHLVVRILFNSNAFCKVTRLVDIIAFVDGDVIRENLQGNVEKQW